MNINQIYENQTKFLNYAKRFLNEQDAEDALQNTIVRIFQHLGGEVNVQLVYTILKWEIMRIQNKNLKYSLTESNTIIDLLGGEYDEYPEDSEETNMNELLTRLEKKLPKKLFIEVRNYLLWDKFLSQKHKKKIVKFL